MYSKRCWGEGGLGGDPLVSVVAATPFNRLPTCARPPPSCREHERFLHLIGTKIYGPKTGIVLEKFTTLPSQIQTFANE